MLEDISCAADGQQAWVYVCHHLVGEVAGLGFNRGEPGTDSALPAAWCDNCELIRTAHNGWNQESEKLTTIVPVCSKCYELASIRNAHTATTLDALASLRWKCRSCEEWHTGPILDLSYNHPHYWPADHGASSGGVKPNDTRPRNFLNSDYCVIDDRDFFVRGFIPLPIIGTLQQFCWGVWGSLSRDNFEKLIEWENDPQGGTDKLPGMFSWLSNRIDGYPDTLSLKMYAHVQRGGMRPTFELEPTDHPLAHEFHRGISPERVKEITLQRVREMG